MISNRYTQPIKRRSNKRPQKVNPITARLDKWFKRNAIGEQKESEGKFEEAIRVYEANVNEDADTIFSYERLSILYKRRSDMRNEVRILKKAIRKLQEKGHRKRLDTFQENQMNAFQQRLMEITGDDPFSLRAPMKRMHGLI